MSTEQRPAIPEAAFADKVVELGVATREQVRECREVLERMGSMGVQDTLAAVMVKKGVLTQHQVTDVLRALGLQVQPVPGYILIDRVGKGGYGEVFRARQLSMDRLVALKILSPKATASKNFVERFFKEAQSAAKLNHRAIIQAYDAGCANGLYYFAMEFVPGETARDLVKKNGPFPEKRALEILLEVLDALSYIHKHRLIHRDIKPENFLITQDGRVKICDFGLAKSEEVEDTGAREGYTLGTPYYMSPEQISGDKNLDIRSDLYSLGSTVFYLLTGVHLFEGKDTRAVMSQHLNVAPRAPSAVVPGIRKGTDSILLKLLQKDRRRRYATPDQASQDVRRVLQGASPAYAGSGPRRRLLIMAGAGIAAAAAITVGILAIAFSGGEPTPRPPEPPPPIAQPPLPPPSIENPTPIAQPPTPPPQSPTPALNERELRAEGAYARAEIRFRDLSDRATRSEDLPEDWTRLEEDFVSLEVEFGTTKYFLDRKREIWDRAETCRDGARRAGARSRDRAEADAAGLRRRFEEGKSLMAAGSWKEAEGKFRDLLQRQLPPDLAYREVDQLAVQCEQEQRASDAWTKIRELQGRGAWAETQGALAAFAEKFGATRTARDRTAEVDALKARCAAEAAGDKAYQELKAAYDARKWDEAAKRIEAFGRDHAQSEAFRAHQAEIEEMARAAGSRLKEPLEKQAKDLWAAVKVEIDKKAFSKARDLIGRLETEPLASTEFARQIKPELDARKTMLDERLAEELNEQAKDLLAQARKLHRDDKVEDAFPIFDKLLKDPGLSASSTVQKQRRMIERDAQKCEKEFEEFKSQLIDGFDGDLKGWESRADGKKGAIESSDDPYSGRAAAKVTFVAHEGKWAYLDRPCRPAPEGALGISFLAKALNPRVVRIRIQFRQGQGDQEAVYRAERDVGTNWTPVRFAWSEFRLVYSTNKQKPPPFDPSKIRLVEFSQGTVDWEGTYLVDRLKFEVR
ncbi:MAG TPA: protein kinase [Planctomycetota bacterium]|nr:protein kinase [Planctomycetota bacterium]